MRFAIRSCRRSRRPAAAAPVARSCTSANTLFTPRDFDISPYFEIVKPTIVHGFDYTALHWADKQKPLEEVAGELEVFQDEI